MRRALAQRSTARGLPGLHISVRFPPIADISRSGLRATIANRLSEGHLVQMGCLFQLIGEFLVYWGSDAIEEKYGKRGCLMAFAIALAVLALLIGAAIAWRGW